MKKMIYPLMIGAIVTLPACGKSKDEHVVQEQEPIAANATAQEEQTERTTMAKQTTQSGLQYEVLQEGTGVSPEQAKRVTVHYTGWLNKDGEPGSKFDSSVDRGQPFSFVIGIGQVIKGWDEGVISMKVGEKRRLFIPSELGYGARGAGNVIPPNSDLIFDVELLAV